MLQFFLSLPAPVAVLMMCTFVFVRYLTLAALFMSVVWGPLADRFAGRRLCRPGIPWRDIRREMGWSGSSAVVFGAFGYLTQIMGTSGWNAIYPDFSRYPTWVWWAAVVAALFCQDFWFYATHRLMHHRKIFPWMHAVHHRSVNPTPFAAIAFHPTEAVVQVAFFTLISAILPFNMVTLGALHLMVLLLNLIGHLGFDLFPSWWLEAPLVHWWNPTTHHHMHHQHPNRNFGLYFNFWDRAFGTNHPDWERRFRERTQIRHAVASHA